MKGWIRNKLGLFKSSIIPSLYLLPDDISGDSSTGGGASGSSGQGGKDSPTQAPEANLGPFKDGQAAYQAWQELQRTLDKREKEYEGRIQELEDTIGVLTSQGIKDEGQTSAEEDYSNFQRDPKGFLESHSEKSLRGIRDEMNLLRFEVRVQRARAKHPDFDSLESDMLDLVKKGVVNPAHPDVVEILYSLVKARKAEENKKAGAGAASPGQAGGKESPVVAEGTKTGPSEPDYSKMSLQELEKLVSEQPGAKSR